MNLWMKNHHVVVAVVISGVGALVAVAGRVLSAIVVDNADYGSRNELWWRTIDIYILEQFGHKL